MAWTLPTLLPSDLERRLLRKGIGEAEASRSTCPDCGRTPLPGERLHRFERGGTVCELCAGLRSGPSEGTEPVRLPEHGQAVRRRAA